ncbi:MAG: 2Fe-2S iron-sulfur cluster-binding protein [Pseudanabaenaceae cyanobacterium bins.39]|nr:2Fe-2S iron-sulfur cluster-binding protein [Pseudanabaenaceae cyanobacterium bins.39]
MTYHIRIRDRQTNQVYETDITGDRYILESLENQGITLPFACRNGACTACAMRVKSGKLDQHEVIGLSKSLQEEGYALICSSYALSDLDLETQDEDEVYNLQFGRYFAKRKRYWFQWGIPIDHE